MDDTNFVIRQPVFSGEVDKFLSIVPRDTSFCPKPHHTIRVAMDGTNFVIRQPVFSGEIDKFLSIVPRNTSFCPKPHHTIRVAMDGTNFVIRQPVFSGEVDKFLSIVPRDTTFCPKPHHTIRVTMNSIDKYIRQSVGVGIIFPIPLFERSKSEVDVFEVFSALNVQDLSKLFISFFSLCVPLLIINIHIQGLTSHLILPGLQTNKPVYSTLIAQSRGNHFSVANYLHRDSHMRCLIIEHKQSSFNTNAFPIALKTLAAVGSKG